MTDLEKLAETFEECAQNREGMALQADKTEDPDLTSLASQHRAVAGAWRKAAEEVRALASPPAPRETPREQPTDSEFPYPLLFCRSDDDTCWEITGSRDVMRWGGKTVTAEDARALVEDVRRVVWQYITGRRAAAPRDTETAGPIESHHGLDPRSGYLAQAEAFDAAAGFAKVCRDQSGAAISDGLRGMAELMRQKAGSPPAPSDGEVPPEVKEGEHR